MTGEGRSASDHLTVGASRLGEDELSGAGFHANYASGNANLLIGGLQDAIQQN